MNHPRLEINNLNKAGLRELSFLITIAELPYVEKIYLFGSRARGDHMEKSDIDLAIKYNSNEQRHREVVKAIITEARDTLLEVDVVDYDEKLSDDFRKIIEEEKVLLYEKA